jgi:hypothetical protein
MTPADNILYFNNDIDVRLCLKNAYTTLRAVWLSCYDPDYYTGKYKKITAPTAYDRYHWAMQKQDLWDQPFRRGSYRIAVKRDPVQRFISAVSYLDTVRLEPRYDNNKKSYIDLTNVKKDDIDSVLDAFDKQTLRDEHFFSQSYFMGHPNDYDKVYDITELPELLSWVAKKCKPKKPIEKLWENKTKNTSNRIELTDKQTMRIIKMYAKDYANGWY